MNKFTEVNYHDLMSKIIRIDRKHRKAIEEQASRFGIHRSQHRMLMYLSKREFYISQKTISKDLEISPAAVAVALKKLECSDLIIRKPIEDDCRYNIISLTEKGKEIVNKSIMAFSEVDKNVFKGLSDDEINQFKHILIQIENNLDER